MQLTETVILPTDNGQLATSLFEHEVFETTDRVAVVVGSDADAQTTVTRADDIAANYNASPPDTWRVIWVRAPTLIAGSVAKLTGDAALLGQLSAARAYSMSPGGVVKDVVADSCPGMALLVDMFAAVEEG